MSKIDHIGLCVKDLEATREFFARYFGAKSGELYHNKRTDFRSYFLIFEGEERLEIMTRPEVSEAGKAIYGVGYSHLSYKLK